MNFRKNGLWLTGQWDFLPKTWGVVGFTSPANCENLFQNSCDGTIVAIYITTTNPIENGLNGKVVGFVKLSREKGCSEKFVCKELWKENQENLRAETKGKWRHGIQITRAWKIIENNCKDVKVKTVFNSTYRGCWMNIATRGVPVEKADFAIFEKLACEEVSVFGQEPLSTKSEITTVEAVFRDTV